MSESSSAGLDVEQLIRRVRAEAARRQPEAVLATALATAPAPLQWRYALGDLLRQDDLAFVTQVYRCVLHREPAHDDLRDGLSRLRNGECSQIDLLRELRFSPDGEHAGVTVVGLTPPVQPWTVTLPQLEPAELPIRDCYALGELLQYRGEAFVRNAYRALLHREPDPVGLAHHLERLAQGATRLEIVQGLSIGAEGRTLAVTITGWPDCAAAG